MVAMNPRTFMKVLPILAGYLAMAWFGNASVTAWDLNGYDYNERVDFGAVLSDMVNAPLGDVVNTTGSMTTLPFLNELMLVSAVALAAHVAVNSAVTRVALFVFGLLSLPYTVLGLLTLVGPYDGEFLAEGWGLLATFSLWTTSAAAFVLMSERRAKSDKTELEPARELVSVTP